MSQAPERRVGEAPDWRAIALMWCLAVVGALVLTLTKRWLPVLGDEIDNLAIARNLLVEGAYSMRATAPFAPTAYREPVYPLLVALSVWLSPAHPALLAHCPFSMDPACADLLAFARALNGPFHALAGLFAGLTARRLGADPWGAALATLLVIVNPMAVGWRWAAQTEYLALFLIAFGGWLAVGLAQRPRLGRAALLGLVAGALCLTKAIFLAGLLSLAVVVAVLAAIDGARARLTATLVAAAVAALVVAPWIARNAVVLGDPVISQSRGGLMLTVRQQWDGLDGPGLACHALWSIRASGDDWCRALFPPEVWRRFGYDAGSLWRDGHEAWDARVQAAMAEGLGRLDAERREERRALLAGLDRPAMRLATTVTLFVQGMFIDEWLPLTLPALAVLVWRAVARRRWLVLLPLAPGLWNAAIHPLLTPNIERFQIPTLSALAIAGGLILPGWGRALWARMRRR
jgi:hypothetical protein